MQLPQLPSYPACTLCDLGDDATNAGIATYPQQNDDTGIPQNVTPPNLTFTAEKHRGVLLVIGQNPGQQEDAANRPFIGACGQSLRHNYLAPINPLNLGVSTYIGNAVRCATQSNAAPNCPQSRACAPHILEDINLITSILPGPYYLLALGSVATRTVAQAFSLPTASQKLSHWLERQGAPHTHNDRTWHLFASYHPGALLRNPKYKPAMRDHMLLLRDAIVGVLPTPSAPRIVTPAPAPVPSS